MLARLKDKNHLLVFVISLLLLVVGAVGLIVTSANAKIHLNRDSIGYVENFVDITGEEYSQMIDEERTFLLFVDQDGCITARGLSAISDEIAKDKNLRVYRIMFSDARKTSLYDKVKYYPSFVIISGGRVVSWLRADADEDIDRFKDRSALESWLDKYIEGNN